MPLTQEQRNMVVGDVKRFATDASLSEGQKQQGFRREGSSTVMPARGFNIIQWFGNHVPSMASCTNCEYKFVTPSTLKHDPTGAEQYLRDKFNLHECKNELKDGKERRLGQNPQASACCGGYH
jgi:hypothetical protein